MIYDLLGNELIKEESKPSLSMFQSIGVIGDSFASGEIYTESLVDYYPVSWIQILGRMSGCEAVNYSKGGLTAQTWLENNEYGLGKLNSSEANNLYVIALGINDTNRMGVSKLGTTSDIESDNTDSFYSYYGRVVRAIKAHAPNAIIMLSTLARFGGNYDLFSGAVRNIGSHYNLDILDLTNSEFFQSEFFSSNQVSNHPIAINYSAMAKEYKRLIESALEENVEKYKTFVG